MAKAQLSKADRIRKLLHLSNAEIGKRTGERQEYIRTIRQRTSPSGNPITNAAARNWASANREMMADRHNKRYATDQDYRRRRDESVARWRDANREHVNAYARKRRAEARAS